MREEKIHVAGGECTFGEIDVGVLLPLIPPLL
jgi:hypothetical protein